ncbi:hypothetical protein NDU88_002953 [Pleurodeles waltl]|uniref:Murine leukemia virus integrase C-terminal domain-containing protein n=1 Tax=Pleurodeles waltl TaxID=8319 RepID=A0AAV7W128_PLEWA|nr:hypothetical protein NDU88_002953 [Pleurodeles waltl]
MLLQVVTNQKKNRCEKTAEQFPLHSKDEIKDEWPLDSSDEEEYVIAASLEVYQRGPYVKGEVHGHEVEATTVQQMQGQGHNLRAGDWVIIRKHVRKSCLEPRWKGPYQVILTTATAVKCACLTNWVLARHTRKVNNPTEQEEELLRLPTAKNITSKEQESEEPNKENDRDVPTHITDDKEQGSEETEQYTDRVEEESVHEEREISVKRNSDQRRVSSDESDQRQRRLREDLFRGGCSQKQVV